MANSYTILCLTGYQHQDTPKGYIIIPEKAQRLLAFEIHLTESPQLHYLVIPEAAPETGPDNGQGSGGNGAGNPGNAAQSQALGGGQHNNKSNAWNMKKIMSRLTTPQLDRTVYGWHLCICDELMGDWDNIRAWGEQKAQDGVFGSRSLNQLRDRVGDRMLANAPNAAWAVRGYVLGPDLEHAGPYMAVLCSNAELAKVLFEALSKHIKTTYRLWGVVCLPKIDVLSYWGGLVKLLRSEVLEDADRLFAPRRHNLSLAASFSLAMNLFDSSLLGQLSTPDNPTNAATIPLTAALSDPLQATGSWAAVTDNGNHLEVEVDGNVPSAAHAASLSQYRCGMQFRVTRNSTLQTYATIGGIVRIADKEYGLTISHVFWLLPSYGADNEGTRDVLYRWEQHGRYRIIYDWALVELPAMSGDEFDKSGVNLVHTTSGSLRPTMAVSSVPPIGRLMILATPGATYGLRGFFAGTEAVVGFSDNVDISHNVWVLRMEEPSLIQPGDSGAWAVDAWTGHLVGILVAGCPSQREAYIMPAHRVFRDIEALHGNPIQLAPAWDVPIKAQDEVQTLFDSYGQIMRTLSRAGPQGGPADPSRQIKDWKQKMDGVATMLPAEEPRPFLPDRRAWVSPHALLSQRHSWVEARCAGHVPDRDLSSDAANMLRLSPLDRYNALNDKLCAAMALTEPNDMHLLQTLWDYIVLSDSEWPLSYTTSEVSRLEYLSQDYLSMTTQKASDALPCDRQTLSSHLLLLYCDMLRSLAVWDPPSIFGTGLDGPDHLLGVLVSNEQRSAVLVNVTPIATVAGIPGLDDRLNDIENASSSWSCAIPMAVWNTGQNEDENLQQILQARLGLHEVAWTGKTKLDWDPEGFASYLQQADGNGIASFYELRLDEEAWSACLQRMGGSVEAIDFRPDESYLRHKFFSQVMNHLFSLDRQTQFSHAASYMQSGDPTTVSTNINFGSSSGYASSAAEEL